jgi:hypothetical protein
MRPRLSPCAVLGVALLSTGCGALLRGEPASQAMSELVAGSQMSAGVLRVRVRALAGPLSGELESVADQVSAMSGSPAVAQAMARFKFEAIPTMQAVLFQPDPVAALIDAWAFLAQLAQLVVHLEDGDTLSSEELALAGRRFAAMEGQLVGLWGELAGPSSPARARTRIHQWALDNPMREVAVRPTTASLLAEVTATGGVTPMGAAAALLETTQDLSARADLLNAWLPKQARWQTEYFTRQALTDPTLLGDQLTRISALTARVTALLGLTEGLPERVTAEREAAMGALSGERRAVQGFVRDERRALMSGLQRERTLLYDFLSEERETTLEQTDRMVRGWIDRVFLLTLLLFAVAIVGAGALMALARRWRPFTHDEAASAGT